MSVTICKYIVIICYYEIYDDMVHISYGVLYRSDWTVIVERGCFIKFTLLLLLLLLVVVVVVIVVLLLLLYINTSVKGLAQQ